MTEKEIRKRMKEIVLKWKGKKPVKATKEWFEYKVDSLRYGSLKKMIKEVDETFERAKKIFGK